MTSLSLWDRSLPTALHMNLGCKSWRNRTRRAGRALWRVPICVSGLCCRCGPPGCGSRFPHLGGLSRKTMA